MGIRHGRERQEEAWTTSLPKMVMAKWLSQLRAAQSCSGAIHFGLASGAVPNLWLRALSQAVATLVTSQKSLPNEGFKCRYVISLQQQKLGTWFK